MSDHRTAGRAVAAILGLCGFIVSTLSLASDIGDPFERRFRPDLDVYPQNFDIAQAADGLIYVANSEGVLEFDGARWRQIKLPGEEFARSLGVDGEGRVYVGSYNHFGVLERGLDGLTRFVELTLEFVTEDQARTLADVWNVEPTPQGVFFATRRQLFLWDGKAVDTWQSDGEGFGTFQYAGGRYLVRERGVGLKELDDGGWRLVEGGERFAETRINAIISLPDASLLVISEAGYDRLTATGVQPMAIEYPGLPKPSHAYRAQLLADGRLALGTFMGEIHVISADGRSGQRYGISDYIIAGLMIGQDGALWAATDEDVVRLSIPSPWSYFGSQHGFSGFVTDVEVFRGERLISTNAGVYRLRTSETESGRAGFERLDWGDNEFWSLLRKPEGLLVAESYTVFLAGDQGNRALTGSIYPRRLVPSRQRDDVVYVAGESGFAVLRREEGVWNLAGDFMDLDLRAYYLVEVEPGTLWVGTYGDGVHRVELSRDFSRIVSQQAFDERNGLKLDATRAVVTSRVGAVTVFATDEGVFEHNGEVFVPASTPAIEAYRGRGFEPGVEFHTRGDDEIWANSGRELFRGRYRDARWDWQKVHLGRFDNTAVEAVVFDGEATWIGAAAALIRFDAATPEPSSPAATVLLRGMQVRHSDQRLETIPFADGASPSLSWGRQTVSFEYAVPLFGDSDGLEFRTQLEGFDTEWSGWRRETEADYSGLAPGWYLFRVQARTSGGQMVGEESVAFQIAPPWFRTPLAYGLYALLALVLFIGITAAVVRWRSRYLRALNRRLEQQIAERAEALRLRTEELELANLKLRELSELDGLTGVANRRRLEEHLARMLERCKERREPLTLLMIDADHFKAYNDRHGHLAGDELLHRLAEVMAARVTESHHLLARYGGEEFSLVLPGYSTEMAVNYGEMIRAAVAESVGDSHGITVSVGIGEIQPHQGEDLDLLLRRADEAMYQAKARGRNCVAA